MRAFTLFAYGNHAIGFPNFGYHGHAFLTNGINGLYWIRIDGGDGSPTAGRITKTDTDQYTSQLRKVFKEGQQAALEIEMRSNPSFGTSRIRTGEFTFKGEALSDFSDHTLGLEFWEMAKYIGMPNGLVKEAAMHILHNLK